MAAIDVIITLAIIIKIIDIIVNIYKKRRRNNTNTNKNKILIIIAAFFLLALLINPTNKSDKNLTQETLTKEINKNNYPAGIYMQPLINHVNRIVLKMSEDMAKNRNQKIKEKKIEVIQTNSIDQEFKAQYKKPEECYNMKDHETRMFCANSYIRAKATFKKVN